MSESTVYVVTGANRGIGLALVRLLLARPQIIIVGSVRSDAAKAQLLAGTESVVPGAGSKVLPILLDFSSGLEASDVENAITLVLKAEGITHVDVVVANAGYTTNMEPVVTTTPAQMRELYEVNTIGPLVTFQGAWELLSKGRKEAGRQGKGRFALVSSSVGSVGMMEPFPGGAYGPSKAAANWLARAVHLQCQGGSEGDGNGVVGVALHPGFVKTEMGNTAARSWGLPEGHGPNVEAGESAEAMLDLVDRAEELGGKFVMEGGKELAW